MRKIMIGLLVCFLLLSTVACTNPSTPASADELIAVRIIFGGISNMDTEARVKDGYISFDKTESKATMVILRAFEEKFKYDDKDYSVTYNSGTATESQTEGGSYSFNTTIEGKSYVLKATSAVGSYVLSGTINEHTFEVTLPGPATEDEQKDALKIITAFTGKSLDDECYEVTFASDYITVTVIREFETTVDDSVVKIISGSIKITEIDLSAAYLEGYSSSITASVGSTSYTLSDLTISGGVSEDFKAYLSLKGLVNGHILNCKEEIGPTPATDDEKAAAAKIIAVFTSNDLANECQKIEIAPDNSSMTVTVIKEFEGECGGSTVKIKSGSMKITGIDWVVSSMVAHSDSIEASVDSTDYTLTDLTLAGSVIEEGSKVNVSLKGYINGHILDYKGDISPLF